MSETAQRHPLRIVCDSREQAPFRFEGLPVVLEAGTLEAGDYSLHGFERRVAVERKSLPDLVACLSGERERFARELARLRGFDAAAVVVEQPQSVLRLGQYRSTMSAVSAWQSCLALAMRYRVPFWFCDSRTDAEQVTFDILRHFARDRWRELQALTPAASVAPERTGGQRPGADMAGTGEAPEGRTGAESGRPPLPPDVGRESMGPFGRGAGSRLPSPRRSPTGRTLGKMP